VIDSKQYRGPTSVRFVRAAVAWPLPPRPRRAGRVVRGRPGRPGPDRPRHGGGASHGRPRRPGPLGKIVMDGVRWWRPGACQACCAPSRPCWGPSGSPLWPTRRGSAFTLPPDRQSTRDESFLDRHRSTGCHRRLSDVRRPGATAMRFRPNQGPEFLWAIPGQEPAMPIIWPVPWRSDLDRLFAVSPRRADLLILHTIMTFPPLGRTRQRGLRR
jgi:hypothetical protein